MYEVKLYTTQWQYTQNFDKPKLTCLKFSNTLFMAKNIFMRLIFKFWEQKLQFKIAKSINNGDIWGRNLWFFSIKFIFRS